MRQRPGRGEQLGDLGIQLQPYAPDPTGDREDLMTPFPREDYRPLRPYDPGRAPVALDLSDNTNLWGPHPAALEVAGRAPTFL